MRLRSSIYVTHDVAGPGATLNDDPMDVVLSAGRVVLLVLICYMPLFNLLVIDLESSTLPRKQKNSPSTLIKPRPRFWCIGSLLKKACCA